MRILTYNILDGGTGRADPLGEVIEAQNVDIVCLIECGDDAVRERIARRLRMDVVVGHGSRGAVACLSRRPIVQSINHSLLCPDDSATILEATVLMNDGAELPLAIVHLTAHAAEANERRREEEVNRLLAVMAEHRRAGRPHLLAGDFNANAPTQRIDPEACKPSTREEWSANGGLIPRRAVQKLLDAGYVESLAACHGPAADTMTSFTTHQPGQRVDYIWGFGVSFTSAWIERDRLATFASDHYPVGCEIAPAAIGAR